MRIENPGSRVRPSRSTRRAPRPAAARTASKAPTARMVCPRTATASADGCASSMVRIGPPWKTVVAVARAWTAPADIRPLAAAPAINSRRSR